MPLSRLFNCCCKAQGLGEVKKRESISGTEMPETLGCKKATSAEVEAGGASTESTSQKLKEMYQEVCSIMNKALLGESSSVEEMRNASQAIFMGQNLQGVCQQEEWSPKNWFNKFTQLVEQAVTKKIPQPPLDRLGSGHPEKVLKEYLQLVQATVLEELRRLAPGLRETPLLDCVVENFHRHIFAQLDKVLQCTMTADKAYLVLYWAACVYLSEELMSHPDIKDSCFKAVDLLVLSDWMQRAEKVFLAAVQGVVSERLCCIHQNEKIYWDNCIPGDEENFIKLHIDVIQVVHAWIEQAGKISKLLKVKVQEICYLKLLDFLEKYVEKEKKQLKMHAKSGDMYPFRTFCTSMELRKYAQTIATNKNDKSIKAVHSLKRIEDQSLKLVLRKPLSKAKATLKEYFKKEARHKMGVIEEIREYFITLPKTNQDAYKKAVDTAYDRLTCLYLKHLLQSNRSKLERTWSDVGSEVTGNAEYMHRMFSHLNPEVIPRNQALLNVGKLLKCNDLNAQTVIKMKTECPDMSQEQVRSLLQWKGLSRSQVNEVLEAGRECWIWTQSPTQCSEYISTVNLDSDWAKSDFNF
ncbi:tumor necrosis factor alpha-induced protein 2 [Conger conger]|uniref:tumor necrosis factor alpha-induced protein 2 n=1 Tax=Conger conger TaxID=82655 RepID=UPI002A5A16AF|nr:tumor necrosis factor alpha-induced protein 2 [Conger conger]